MDINEVIDEIMKVDQLIANAKERKQEMENRIKEAVETEVRQKLEGNPYGAGTCTISTNRYKIKYSAQKKVKWDQDKMRVIYNKIKESGDDPESYIDVKFNCPETRFKSWSSAVQKTFEPARSVSTYETIKFEEV